MSRGWILAGSVLAALSFFGYSNTTTRPDERPRRPLLPVERELAAGRKAAPALLARHGGPSPDRAGVAQVGRVGHRLLGGARGGGEPYRFAFRLLADTAAVTAYALPDGQVFVTEGLLGSLGTEGQLAAVLAHQVAHVLLRHPGSHLVPRARTAAAPAGAAAVRFTPPEEAEADRLAVELMAEAGYDPTASVELIRTLNHWGGRPRPPEFFGTHPSPERRIQRLQVAIKGLFPDGVPGSMTQ